MDGKDTPELWTLLSSLFRAHPWHGVAMGDDAPQKLTCFIEIVPTDTVKYEVDKPSGLLKVDRPQKYSSLCPTLYGFIPQTFCAEQVGAFAAQQTGREAIDGDGDPMDICVLSEKAFSHGDFIVRAIPIGGLRMIDGNQADDKIIAVMENDAIYGQWRQIGDIPAQVVERLTHYFETYKDPPGSTNRRVEITDVYDREEAYQVIQHSIADYQNHYGNLGRLLEQLPHRNNPLG